MEAGETQDPALERLRKALDEQRSYLVPYEKPSAQVTYEVLRALDDLFCRDLMEPSRTVSESERRFRALSTWGVNHAFRRMIPRLPGTRPFRNFPSHSLIQEQADDFLFNCALLGLAERYEGLLREGILTGTLRHHSKPEIASRLVV